MATTNKDKKIYAGAKKKSTTTTPTLVKATNPKPVSKKGNGKTPVITPSKSTSTKKTTPTAQKTNAQYWAEQASNLYKNRNTDALFTKEYFTSTDKDTEDLFKVDIKGASPMQAARNMNTMIKLQSGLNYRAKNGISDDYAPGDALYGVNDTANQNLFKGQIDTWFEKTKGDEAEVQEILSYWKADIDAATDNSEYKKRLTEMYNALDNWAVNTYTGAATRKMNEYYQQVSRNKRQIQRMQDMQSGESAQDIAAAQAAMEWLYTGADPVQIVQNDETLRRITNFDTLAAKYDDPFDLGDALRESITQYSQKSAAYDPKKEDLLAELRYETDALEQEMNDATAHRDQMAKTESYKKLLHQAWTINAADGYDVDDYQYKTVIAGPDEEFGEERYILNSPTLPQIMENPDLVEAEWQKTRGAGGEDGTTGIIERVKLMTPGERQLYKALYNEKGEEAAQEYYDSMSAELDAREMEQVQKRAKKLQDENAVLANIASFGTNVLGGIGRLAAAVKGEGVTSQANQFGAYTDTIREETNKDIKNPVLRFMYNTGMAAGDVAVSGFVGGKYANILQAAIAAGSGYMETIENTGDVNKARLVGGIEGFIEGITEKISWGKLDEIGDLTTAAGRAGYIGKNMITEAVEESISSIGSDVTRIFLEGKKNEIIERFTYYHDNGYTAKEAGLMVFTEQLKNVALEGLAGGITGGVLSGVNVATDVAQQNAVNLSTGRAIERQGNVAEVLRAGLSSGDEAVKKVSQALMNKLNLEDPSKPVLPNDAETKAQMTFVKEGISEKQKSADTTKQQENNQQKTEQTMREPVAPKAEISEGQQAADTQKQQENNAERTEKSMRAPAQAEGITPEQKAADTAKQQANNEKRTESQMRALTKKEARQVGKVYQKVMKALDLELDANVKAMSAKIRERLHDFGEDHIQQVTDSIAAVVLGQEVTIDQLWIAEAAAMKDGVIKDIFDALKVDAARISELGSATTRNIAEQKKAAQGEMRAEKAMPKSVKSVNKASITYTTEAGDTIDSELEGFTTSEGGDVVAVVGGESVPVDELDIHDEGSDMLIHRAVGMQNAEAASLMYDSYEDGQDVDSFATAFEAAYHYGEIGIDKAKAKIRQIVSTLTDKQFEDAYIAGSAAAAARPRYTAAKTGGKVTYHESVVLDGLDDNQKSAINALKRIAEIGTVNIEFFQSQANEQGEYTAENGSYDPATNTIRIDLNAGKNSKNDAASYALLRTASHELTHFIKAHNASAFKQLQDFVISNILEREGSLTFDDLVASKIELARRAGRSISYETAVEEVVADGCEMMLKDSTAIQQLAQNNKSLFKRIRSWLRNFVQSVKRAFRGVSEYNIEARLLKNVQELQKKWDDALVSAMESVRSAQDSSATAAEIDTADQQKIDTDQPVSGDAEIKHSIRSDEKFAQMAFEINQKNGFVSSSTLKQAMKDRKIIRDIFTDPANKDILKLPPDIEGDTFVSDSSYGGTEENTTVCIRSMAAQALMDLISENLGRPLTVQDTLLISQEIAGLTDKPECYYCYVATDRRAYRDFLGQYLEQRDSVIEKYKSGAGRAELYTEFLGGRKPTANMKTRFNMWLDAVDNGTELISGNDLASLEKLFAEVDHARETILEAAAEKTGIEKGKLNIVNGSVRYAKAGKKFSAITLNALAKSNGDIAEIILRYQQLTDATAYAQSASWAKKMKGYAAYNGHILKWSQKRVNDLNKHYGLRMYSFSDFSPAFILENMQMVTDASVRGLNMLGYTKEMDFAEIFAPSGMNINISTFAYEQGGDIKEDYMQGASWARAQALREKHPNVGIVMVATSDNILEWALQQDWVDVVIPYHLVRTGTDVAEYFGYKNYTGVSADGKGLSFADINKGKSKKEKVTSVSPVEHRNDLISYVDALQRYGLTPRFAKWLNGLEEYLAGDISPKQFRAMNPNYMKLVNETRRSYADTQPVQPVFNTDAAKESIEQMARDGGYYKPIGGSVDSEFEISGEVADKIRAKEGVKYSLRSLTPSERDLLLTVADPYAKTEVEKEFLGNYRKKIGELNDIQEQLHEIRSDIWHREKKHREQPETMTKDSMLELQKQKNRAKILADQINRKDNEIITLVGSKPMQKVLRDVMEVANQQGIEKRRAVLKAAKERRDATELRRKIRGLTDDFNRRLLKPTEKNYIPKDMVQMVIAAQELVDTRSGREGVKAKDKLARIRSEYAKYKGDGTFAYVHDPVIDDMLAKLENTAGEKNIYQLNKAELTDIYNTLKALRKQVTEAVRLKAGDYAATIFDAGTEMYRETRDAAPLAKGKIGEFLNWQLTPDKFFARLAGYKKGSIWEKVAKSFSYGTQTMLEIQREAYYHFRQWTESKEFDKLNSLKNLIDIGLKDADGKPVLITRGMMLEVYMHLSSEDNMRAFMYGGFSVPNLKKYYAGKVAESYGTGSVNTMGTSMELAELAEQLRDPDLSDDQRAEIQQRMEEAEMRGFDRIAAIKADIESKLTAWDKGLIEAVHEWNDINSRNHINDVTMDLYGIKRAQVDNYYPIHRDKAFVTTDFESISRNVNLENWGALKDRVPSRAPVLLGDLAFTVDNSVNQMSRYVGYARAQRDFSKLYNVRLPGMSGSVKKIVGTKFGTGTRSMGVSGEQYLENYIGSITGSRKSESDFLSVIRRNLPRATMSLNYRVGFSQLSAIPKAAVEVGWGNMAKGLANGGMKAVFSKKAREELAQRNVWFWQRYQGEGGQREFADIKGGTGAIDKAWGWVDDKTKGWMLNLNQKMDVAATVSMWSAAKAWARSNGYTEGTAAFDKAANEKYTDILRNTQAANTVSERSDLARSTGFASSILTMYKSEAFANFNILYDSVARWRKTATDLKEGKNGVTKADVRNAALHCANSAATVVVASSLLNAILKLGVNAIFSTMDSYRDDDDEVTGKSIAMAITGEVLNDAAGMVAIGGNIYEAIAAMVTDDKYYAPTYAALDEVTTLAETLINFVNKDDKGLDDYLKTGEKLTMSTFNMFGIPGENAKRQIKGLSQTMINIFDGNGFSYNDMAERSTDTNLRRLVKAELAGDKQKWDAVYKELSDNYLKANEKELTEKEFVSKLKSHITKEYKDGNLTKEEATTLLKNRTDITSEDELFWWFDERDYAIENGGSDGYSKDTQMKEAVSSKSAAKINEAITFYTSHGYSKDDAKTEVQASAKELYFEGKLTWEEALDILLEFCNSSKNNFDDEHAQYWLKREWDYAKANNGKKGDYSKYSDFYDAIENGKDASKLVNELFEHAKNKKEARKNAMTSIGGRYRNDYIDAVEEGDTAEAERIMNLALDAYVAIGLNRAEEKRYILKNWKKDK